MFDFLVRRSATILLVLVGVSVITYGLMFFTPGDPARTILRQQSGGQAPSDEAVVRAAYYQDTPVSKMIADRFPETLELAIAGLLVALLISIPTGVVSAVHKGQWPDYLSQVAALLGVSMPNFWLGYLLIIVFSLYLGLFPISGAGGLDKLILPAVTLGSGMAAIVTRLVRSSMLEVLEEDYIRTARSKGLRQRIVVYKHALRNALIPVVTIVGLQFGYLLNGAVIVEIVFQRPGIGKLLIDALFARDYPVVQGLVLLIAAIFVLTNFLVDVTYRFIDPRITFEGGER
jgi:peptide/nickel transport system permease protein